MIVCGFIYVAEHGTVLFFLMAEQFFIVYTHHIFFIHLSVDEHLGCSHVLAIVNSVAMNIEHVCLFELDFCPDTYPRAGLLDHVTALSLIF